MGCCISSDCIYWQENLLVYRDWEKAQGTIPELKIRLCLSQYGQVPLDRKLLWLRISPGFDFPLVITPNTTKEQLTKDVIPYILEKYGKDKVSLVCIDGDEVSENIWSDTKDGQYLIFDTFYKRKNRCC